MKEHDVVIARKDLPNQSGIGSAKRIAKGQRGTVLMAYEPSDNYPRGACEVEFCKDLETLAVMLVDARDLELSIHPVEITKKFLSDEFGR